jgi:hypothetical protein
MPPRTVLVVAMVGMFMAFKVEPTLTPIHDARKAWTRN